MSDSAPTATRFASRSHSRVAYDPGVQTEGAQTTRPVAAIHDLLSDRTSWKSMKARLGSTRRVILPDLRGHGASATLTNQWYTVGEMVADVLAILDAERIDRIDLAGHGLGAAVAYDLARRHPDRVGSLALIAPALYGVLDNDVDPIIRQLRNDQRTTDRSAADASYKGLTDRALDLYFQDRRGTGWRDSLTKPRHAAIRRHAVALAALLPALDSYQFERPAGSLAEMPVLIAVPVTAPRIDVSIAERLETLFPTARRCSISSDALDGRAFLEALSTFFDASGPGNDAR